MFILDFHSSVIFSFVVVMVFFSMLFFMGTLLFANIFWFRFWFSNNDEAIIFKFFDLLSSELTNLFIRIWASAIFSLSLLTSFLFVFRLVLTSFSFTFSSVVISSVVTFTSVRSVSVISVVSVISSLSLFLLSSNWLLWLLWCWWNNSLLLNNRSSFLLDSNLRDLRNLRNNFSNWFWFSLDSWNLRLRWNYCFYFSNRFFSLNFLFFRLLSQDIIDNLFLVDLNVLDLIISVFLNIGDQSFL